ncbi:hypothetical protein ARTHRO9AX_180114 [Arthrobacter sp. 9AX]|nr:hypothetical protein ARTHRO9AX_180114 [Arthrobacter sp. 9AX]
MHRRFNAATNEHRLYLTHAAKRESAGRAHP